MDTTSTAFTDQGFSDAEPEVYQSVSRSAVASLTLGVFGLTAFPFVPMLLLPILGLLFALLSFRAFAKFPGELLGRPIAMAGLVLCGVILVVAPTRHVIIYMTEVPDGYQRLNFSVLKSDYGQQDIPPERAFEFDGKQVFIKGYIHPNSMANVLSKRFVLVPDLGTCCFGKQPPLTHMIEVSLSGDQYARKSLRKQRLAGVLKINPSAKPVDGLGGVFYQLRADVLK